MTGAEMQEMDTATLRERVRGVDVFVREPEHKPRLGQVATSPSSKAIPPTLSPRVFPEVPVPYHLGPQVTLTCYFPCGIGLPKRAMRRHTVRFQLKRLHSGANFRGCSHFFMFRPLGLLATLVAPTHCSLLQAGL